MCGFVPVPPPSENGTCGRIGSHPGGWEVMSRSCAHRAWWAALVLAIVSCEDRVPVPRSEGAVGPGGPGDYTILVFGDSGTGSEVQYAVGRSMAAVCESIGCDIGLIVGDVVYGSALTGGDDPRLDHVFGRPYAALTALGVPLFSVAGNHDVESGLAAQADYAARHPTWTMLDYSAAVPGTPEWVHVFGLFTPPIFKRDESIAGDPLTDFEGPLAEARAFLCDAEHRGWRIAFGHHPLFSKAHGRSRRLADRMAPLIRECGLDFYLAGHAHQQEHTQAEGVDQLIQGVAGAPREAGGWFKRGPRPRFHSEVAGFGVLRLSRGSARVNFFDERGALIYSWDSEAGAP